MNDFAFFEGDPLEGFHPSRPPQDILGQMKFGFSQVHPLHKGRGLHLARSSASQPVPQNFSDSLKLKPGYFIWPKISPAERPGCGIRSGVSTNG